MFCSNCGKKLDDHLKFCTDCGAPVVRTAKPAASAPAPQPKPAPQPAPPPAYTPAPAPKQKKKVNPLLIILPIVAAVVLLVGGAVLAFITGVFDSNETKIIKAVGKSVLAYQEASAGYAAPVLFTEDEAGVSSQAVSLQIEELPSMPELEGFGMQVNMDTNLPGRELGLSLTPRYGSVDILDADLVVNDAELYLAIPQLAGERVYMVNTELIGPTLENFGIYDEDLAKLGFNFFDLVDIAKEAFATDEEALLKLTEAVTIFAQSITAEKLGKEEMDIHDSMLKCDVYEVVIPEDAIKDLFHAYKKIFPDTDIAEVYVDLFQAMGMPEYMIEEFSAEIGSISLYGDTFDALDDLLDELGDIELEVYLHKGYVAAVSYEGSVEDVDFEIRAYLGGGENYADDLSIEFVFDEGEILLESHGDHTYPDGIYTDTTTIEISASGSEEVQITSEVYFEPQAEDENFSWNLDADMLKIELTGQITAEETAVNVQFDEVSLWAEGEHLLNLSMDIRVQQYEGISLNTRDALDLMYMTEDDMLAEISMIEETTIQWATELMESNPELVELLGSLSY